MLILVRTQKRTMVVENAKLAVPTDSERRTGPRERSAVTTGLAMGVYIGARGEIGHNSDWLCVPVK